MIDVRKAQPKDLQAIQKLNQQLFCYELSEIENDNWNFDWPYGEDGEKNFN